MFVSFVFGCFRQAATAFAVATEDIEAWGGISRVHGSLDPTA